MQQPEQTAVEVPLPSRTLLSLVQHDCFCFGFGITHAPVSGLGVELSELLVQQLHGPRSTPLRDRVFPLRGGGGSMEGNNDGEGGGE